jgi:hypothetical protein
VKAAEASAGGLGLVDHGYALAVHDLGAVEEILEREGTIIR